MAQIFFPLRRLITLVALGSLSVVLQGCGGGGGGNSPTPAPAGGWRSQVLNPQKTATLQWQHNTSERLLFLKLTVTLPSGASPGYIAVGFSPDGMMEAGDYIMGYMSSGQPCVRALTNGAKGSIPTSSGALMLNYTSVVINGDVMSLAVARPLTGANPIKATGEQKVLFAVGSASSSPKTCDDALSGKNHHDLGTLVGHTDISFGDHLSGQIALVV